MVRMIAVSVGKYISVDRPNGAMPLIRSQPMHSHPLLYHSKRQVIPNAREVKQIPILL